MSSTFSCDAVPMWPYVRRKVIWLCYSRMTDVHFSPVAVKHELNRNMKGKSGLTSGQILSELDSLPSADILIFTTAVHRVTEDGKDFNKYASPLQQEVANTLIFEDNARLRPYCHELATFNHFYVFEYARLMPAKIEEEDAAEIALLIAHIRECFGQWLFDQDYISIEHELSVIGTRLPSWRIAYHKIFQSTTARLIILEDACYGKRTHLVKWAKEHGIRVAEFQHGFIDREHAAYNFNTSKATNDYARICLPDDFLFFGEYWRRNNTLPMQQKVIGNPYYQIKLAQSECIVENTILVCINGFDMDYIKAFLGKLKNFVGNWHITLRVHPNLLYLLQYIDDVFPDTFSLSPPSIPFIEELCKTQILIAEPSTVIFESLAAGKTTYLLPTRNYTYANIKGLKSLDELDEILENGKVSPNICSSPDYYFDSNWRVNFKQYIEDVCSQVHCEKVE